MPAWVILVHVAFMGWTIFNAHYPALFVAGLLFFLGFAVVNDALFGSAVASATTTSAGVLLVGGGVGARSSNAHDVSDQTSRIPHDLVALCVPGTPPGGTGKPCTGQVSLCHWPHK